MMQAIQDTDFFVLSEFREKATALKSSIEGQTKAERVAALQGFVGPFLKRLQNNGWSQRDRILTLTQIWNEV
jgi:hypothetical protein